MANAFGKFSSVTTSMNAITFALVTLAISACSASSSGNGPAVPARPVGPQLHAANAATAPMAPIALTPPLSSVAPSVDRVTMDTVMQKAQQENKSVVLEVAAAWCGPCTQFAYDLDTHPQYLQTLASNGYIFVKGESERSAGSALLDTGDFLPSITMFFPSFYLYTPASGWRTLGPLNSYQSLSDALHDVGAKPVMSVADMKTFIETTGANPQGDLNTGATAELFNASIWGLSANYTYADAKAIYALLRSENTTFPNLQLGDIADQLGGSFIEQYYSIGAVSLATLTQDFPVVASAVTDVSQDTFTADPFQHQLAIEVRSVGVKATASECSSLWQQARARLVPGTLAAADFQAKLTALDQGAAVICETLDLEANGPSDALKQAVAANPASANDWSLIGALGQTQNAVNTYHQRFLMFITGYNSELQQMTTDLATAQAAGDQAKIADLTQEIAVKKFQIQNHTSVDTEVEGALSANQPVHVLKVMN